MVTILKVDIDVKLDKRQFDIFLDTRMLMLKYLNLNVLGYSMSESQKGYHFWFIVDKDLSDRECAFLQFLLGDDIKRYKYNLIRVEAGCFGDFNVLFEKKKYRGFLRRLYDRLRRGLLEKFLTVSQVVLGFSGVMDLLLWVYRGFLIPCFTVTLFCIGLVLLIEVLKRLLLFR